MSAAQPNTDCFRPDPCGFWRDLSLPLPLPEAQVIALCRIAARVNEGRFDTSSGTIAVFTGSDAAGKLMAAEALAYETQRTLHRVDEIEISTYDGQFLQILNTAREENAILMFDNADDLPVSLLESLKDYPGLSILTMDSAEDTTAAVGQSPQYVVDFPFPTETE